MIHRNHELLLSFIIDTCIDFMSTVGDNHFPALLHSPALNILLLLCCNSFILRHSVIAPCHHVWNVLLFISRRTS